MNEIKEEIKNILSNKTVVIAVSGGPDSMCLLKLLIDMKEKINIIVAHVNHNLRKESIEEEEMVKDFCAKNKIKCITYSIKEYKGNVENYARKKRYIFFETLIKKYNARYLLTAHHGDDLTETILMRLSKGSNIETLIGFKKISKRNNYYIYRPLIKLTKEDIVKYCTQNHIPYRVDKTNLEDIYTRNRFRNHIIKPLKKENPRVHINFIKFSEKLTEIEKYIDNEANKIKKQIYKSKKINIIKLCKQDKIIKEKIVYSILKDEYQSNIYLIKEKTIDKIIDIIDSKKPNQVLNLPLNKLFIKSYTYAKIEEKKEYEKYEYILKEELKLKDGHIIKIVKESTDTSNNIIRLNSKEIKLPLHIRTRKDGDKIHIKGLNGNKKIKDIFIDEKISKERRNTYPIVTDNSGTIIWLPGLKKSKFDVSISENYDIIIKYFKERKF